MDILRKGDINMMISLLGLAAGFFMGYQWGYVKGYQQKEDDDRRIEAWK